MLRILSLLWLTLLLACGDDDRPELDTGRTDTGTTDTGTTDTGTTDTGTPDTGTTDTGTTDTGTTDTGVMDGGSIDAGSDVGALDGGSACNGLGEMCTSGGTCDGSECLEAQNICVPSAAFECGGFAGATCPGGRPECLYPVGASGGVCMTAAQRACVCSTSDGRTAFPACAE